MGIWGTWGIRGRQGCQEWELGQRTAQFVICNPLRRTKRVIVATKALAWVRTSLWTLLSRWDVANRPTCKGSPTSSMAKESSTPYWPVWLVTVGLWNGCTKPDKILANHVLSLEELLGFSSIIRPRLHGPF